MGEGKEYVSRSDELGSIHISEEVLAVIAAAAVLEVEGIGGLAANLGTDLAELLELSPDAVASSSPDTVDTGAVSESSGSSAWPPTRAASPSTFPVSVEPSMPSWL